MYKLNLLYSKIIYIFAKSFTNYENIKWYLNFSKTQVLVQ